MWLYIEKPTPVLNTADFSFAFGSKSGSRIPLNEKDLPYLNEFVALKDSWLKIEKRFPNSFICQVSSPNYPSHLPLFIDSRFGTITTQTPRAPVTLPPLDEMLEKMTSLIGKPYVWGGNYGEGIPEMLKLYPPKHSLNIKHKTLWTFSGVDCSGLLYEASQGLSPRNTKELLLYGKKLLFSSTQSLLTSLKPLDMILYPGHVLFVLNKDQTIESKYPFGVIVCNLKQRISYLLNNHPPLSFLQFRRFL